MKKTLSVFTIALLLLISCTEKNSQENQGKNYEHLGEYYRKQNINDSAYSYYLKAEKEYTRINDKENIAKMLLTRASMEFYDGDLEQSKKNCLEAIVFFNALKENQNKRDVYDAYNILGIIANDQQDHNKAIDYHNKALEVIKNDTTVKNKDLLEIVSLNNLGVAYQKLNQDQLALSYFDKALELNSLYERLPKIYAMLLDNKAYSLTKLKEHTGVEELFEQALL